MTAEDPMIEGADWPLFGWIDDVRPALEQARRGARPVVLATLYRISGSAPRGPGAQMLFDGRRASGYFSGDCVEGDVARHAAEVLASRVCRHLHYGQGSPWIDIRLRCGGALHILLEPVAPDSPALADLLDMGKSRRPCRWVTDGTRQTVELGTGPLLAMEEEPFRLARRFAPARRVIVSGGDPGALALAALAAQAGFETILVRPDGPTTPPPLGGLRYLRTVPAEALARLGVDEWTAFIGATHEDHHDLPACLHALRHRAGWVGMIGAKSRSPGRLDALRAIGASESELARLRLSPGIAGLGKSPWEVATGIVAEVMQALNPMAERA
ncbi:MAG: XdhC family protein [Novosphingobium sp.]